MDDCADFSVMKGNRPFRSGQFSWLPSWVPLLGLAALVLTVYRRHLIGEALFLGNFDRLNSFLNTLWLQVRGWQTGRSGGWDDSMFMGRNLYALPFTYPNPLNQLVALFPTGYFYQIAGLVSIALHVLAGWSAYWFIREICRDRFAAFCGAAVYQFTALAVLKVSQNDMSFAVLIDIPLLLLALRRIEGPRPALPFAALTAVLAHMLIFCFLQKVAYALLLAGFYAVTLSWMRRTWLPLVALAAAGTLALLAGFPRILGILQEMKLLQRQISPDFNMQDFTALYHWQNFKAFDVWRWFSDGLFGRFFSEAFALHNNLNITEGMLMCGGLLVPFLLIGGLIRWERCWGGAFRKADGEVRFFYGMVALALAVVASMSVYQIFWEAFLRLDFTHTRIVIAALIPQSALIALIIARLRAAHPPPSWLTRFFSVGCGGLACTYIYYYAGVPESAVPVPLTDSLSDVWHYPFDGFLALLSDSGVKPTGTALAWMNAAVLNRVVLSAVLMLLVACLASWTRSRRWFGPVLPFFLAGFMLVDAWNYADLQNNGAHVNSAQPYYSSHSYWPQTGVFHLPAADEVADFCRTVAAHDYRVALLSSTKELPLFTAPHIAPTWNLRVVEGYSSGVPVRLALLPWPDWALGLRTMTFGAHQAKDLPWRLLGFTNVKNAVRIHPAHYQRGPGRGAAEPEIVSNPERVTPRLFVPAAIRVVATPQAARDAFFPTRDAQNGPMLDPTQVTLVESPQPLQPLGQTGDVTADYAGDRITLRMSPTLQDRIVVVNELFHPAWHAYSNGQRIPILPANVVMRGVLVPAGATEVVLRFEPFGRPVMVLLFSSIATLLLALAVVAISRSPWAPRFVAFCGIAATPLSLPIVLNAGWKNYRPAMVLALLSLVLVVPLFEGRAWNAIGPMPFNTLNPPAGYTGPVPEVQITAESWGASGVMVPFHARLYNYFTKGIAPRWNPYQGLGQPFAAQGEGCPYSLPAILRAFLPFTQGNTVTVGFAFLGALAMYGFLRRLELGEGASLFGAVAWLFSGAITLHLARPNIAEQASTIPILFWAAASAVQARGPRWGACLALAATLHLLGGFIQIAMLSGVACAGFILFYHKLRGDSNRAAFVTARWFILGHALGLFFLLPLIEAMQGSVNKNVELLAMIPMPYANIIAFFLPRAFGDFFQSWVPGQYPDVVNWDNLFAFAGTLPLLLILVGLSRRASWPINAWRLFALFAGTSLFLQLRYINFPPISIVNMLPILGRQSPKHAGSLMVFTSITAAAFALHNLRSLWSRRAYAFVGLGLLGLVSCGVIMVVRQGGWSRVNVEQAHLAFIATGVVTLAGLLAIHFTARQENDGGLPWLALAVVVGEGLLYLPLGTVAPDMTWGRLALMAILVLAAAVLNSSHSRFALVIGLIGLGLFSGFLIPRSNLPLNVDLTQPPAAISWLKSHAGNHYRTFGVHPDASSIWGIQDLSAIGPLTPIGYNEFLRLIHTDAEYKNLALSYHVVLESYQFRYPLTRYRDHKSLFDAAGVRYLFLDKAYFGPGRRTDDSFLRSPEIGMSVAYEDERVRILESHQAQSKFRFTSSDQVIRVGNLEESLARIHKDPDVALLAPAVEIAQMTGPPAGKSGRLEQLEFVSFRPNQVVVRIQTTGSGLLHTADVFDPDWKATVNESATPVLRVNGIFRAVWIPGRGNYEVCFTYCSPWEKYGWWIALAALVWGLLFLWLRPAPLSPTERWLEISGWLLGALTTLAIGLAYFGPRA